MRLVDLSIRDFRNVASAALRPNPRFNIFEGRNGQGKTNVLEAVWVLGALRSFRPATNAELVRFEAEEAEVRGVVETAASVGRTVRLLISPGGRRVWVDGKLARSLESSLGQLSVVLFAPEDLAITKGSPAGRRRFLDRAVFNRWPASLGDLRRYEEALKQRNALLKKGAADTYLEVFDEPLARAGAQVLTWRARYLEAFRPLFSECLTEVTAGELAADLHYEGTVSDATPEAILGALAEDRRKDRARGTTSRGPHRDDLSVMLMGHDARIFASQGQHRSLVLAMKIAEIRLLQAGLGESPILLLDDVSSELDQERNASLMRYLTGPAFGGQVFLTTTDRAHIRIDSDYSAFTIRGGQVG